MRPWPSRSVSGGSCGSVGQYGRPGVLNSNPGQSPDRPGLTERVRLKLRTSGGNSSPRNTPRSSMFRFDDADATFQRLKLTGPFSGGIEAPRTPWASDGRRNRSAALSQADGRKAFVPAARPHDDRVAVFEETARLAGGEFDRPSPGLEHERHGVGELYRLELAVARMLESGLIRSVGQHAIVERDAAGHEALWFGVVD